LSGSYSEKRPIEIWGVFFRLSNLQADYKFTIMLS
jgi:hypothetical protein